MHKESPIPTFTPKQRARFHSRYATVDGGCWEWKGSTNGGYGLIRIKRLYYKAHRVMYFLHYGIDPMHLRVRHACDNPPCVNPDHLILGTQADNVADMMARGRHRVPKGERSPNAKLDAAAVLEIRRRRNERGPADSLHRLAREFGVSSAAISHIQLRKNWAHL